METLKRLISNATLLFSFIFTASFARADIIADQNAAIDQKPVIDNAPNGVPLIQIAPPNQHGISHNRYGAFDITTRGAILNNSVHPTSTQLSGYVVGNNRFRANQSANIILNEVRSANPSLLQGFLEVAGNRADVIVANPNGITCAGCGFLNVNRATLTTGLPTWSSQGDITGFNIQKGEINIDGSGLNALQADQTALLSETIRINALVSANELTIVTGQNQIERHNLNPQKTSSAKRTGINLDISAVGGMYANKIRLIGTDDGMGVRSNGTIAATGDFVINNNGVVELNGRTQIDGAIDIQTSNKFSNTGIVTSGDTTNISAKDIEQKGTLVVGVKKDGILGTQGNARLHADNKILLNHDNWAANDLILDAATIDIVDANLYAKGNMQWLSKSGDISHIRSTSVANKFSLQSASNFINSNSVVRQIGIADTNIKVVNDIINDNGILESAGENWNIIAKNFLNQKGTINHLGHGTLSNIVPGKIVNDDGRIASNGHIYLEGHQFENRYGNIEALSGDLELYLSDTINSQNGTINSNRNIFIDASIFDLTNGSLIAANNVELEISDKIIFDSAVLRIGNALTIDTNELNTSNATISIFGSAFINAETWQNENTQLRVNKNLNVSLADSFILPVNTKWDVNGDANLSVANTWQHQGILNVVGKLTLNAIDFLNAGTINANNIFLQVVNSIRNESNIYGHLIQLFATRINNHHSIIADTLQIVTDYFLNEGANAYIASSNNSYFYIQHDFINQNNGFIYSFGNQVFAKDVNGNKMDSFVNSSATIESESNLFVAANLLINKRAFFAWDEHEIERVQHREKIQDDPACTWKCPYTQNDYDDIYTETFIRSDSAESGNLIAGSDITLQSNSLSNQYSAIIAGKNLSISSDTIENLSFQAKKYLKQIGSKTHWRKVHVHGDDNDYLVVDSISYLNSNDAIANVGEVAGRMIANVDLTANASDIDIQTVEPISESAFNLNQNTEVVAFTGDIIYANYQLPTSNFYHINNDPDAHYLVETEQRFIQYRSFLSSDYYFEHLGFDLTTIQKRLGDGFYEQRLMLEQILALTGKRYLDGFSSTQEQFLSLLDNAIEFSQAFHVQPGMALTAEQMSLLTKDILWMEEKVINGQKVLAPVVYLAHIDSQQFNTMNATITAENVSLNASNNMNSANSNIQASKLLSIQGSNVSDQQSQLSASSIVVSAEHDLQHQNTSLNGATLLLTAGHDISLKGSHVFALDDAMFIAGHDFLIDSIQASSANSYQQANNQFESNNTKQMLSNLTVLGNFDVVSGNDAIFHGADINIANNVSIVSSGNIFFDAVKETQSTNGYGKSHENQFTSSKNDEFIIASELHAGGNINMAALGNNSSINILGSYIGSDHGSVNLIASNDVLLSTVKEQHQSSTSTKTKQNSFLSSNKESDIEQQHEINAIGSVLTGNSVAINAGRDVSIIGSTIMSQETLSLMAVQNINIEAAANSIDAGSSHKEKQNGVMVINDNDSVGIHYGATKINDKTLEHTTTSIASDIVSTNGDVTLSAENNINVKGSLLAAAQDLTLVGKSISISNSVNEQTIQNDYQQEQYGLKFSLESPLMSYAVTHDSPHQYSAAKEFKALADTSVQGFNNVALNLDLFENKLSSQSSSDMTTVISSNLLAGNQLKLISTQSDIDITASDLSANNISLT